jgi:hypothetical protein
LHFRVCERASYDFHQMNQGYGRRNTMTRDIDKGRIASATNEMEIEITEEMVNAAVAVLLKVDGVDDLGEGYASFVVEKMLSAALKARPKKVS